MPHGLLLIAGLTAIAAAVVMAAMALLRTATEHHQVSRSLAAVEAIRTAPVIVRRELDRPFAQRVVAPLVDKFGQLGKRIGSRDESQRLRRKLELAGNPARWDVERVLAFKMLGLIGGFVLGIALPVALGLGLLVTVGVTIVFALLGNFMPEIVLYQLAYNRSEQVRRELPDSIDLLTISVEAGLPFDSALSQVARNTSGPLADELFRVLQEMQIGLGRTDALRALGDRSNVTEVRSFVTALVQAEGFGIPMASVLRVQAKEMRVRRTQRAEELAQKVPVKILFPLIFCILPALFVVVMGPAAISIYHNVLR